MKSALPVSILLVDDSPANLRGLEALLDGRAYRIVKVESGREALRQLQTLDFAVILLDVQMPGLDGFATARMIRARETPRLTPIIFLTVETKTEEMVVKGFSLGAVDYLVRPLEPKILCAKVEASVERMKVHAALQQSEQNFRNSIESSPDGVIVVTDNGQIGHANAAAAKLFHRPPEQLVDVPFGFPITTGQHTELEIPGRDGNIAIVEMRTVQTRWHDSRAFLVSLRDITRRKRDQQQMQHTDEELKRVNKNLVKKNTEIRNFYHTLSHELKTPLTSAREFVSIVMDGLAGPLTPTQSEYLGLAKESCDQLRVYINDLLDVTRLETGKLTVRFKPVALGGLADQMVRMMQPVATSKGIDLQTDLVPDLPEVSIDESRIVQLLSNLLNNALKFTAGGGKIRLQVRPAPQKPDFLRVSICDTGRGIPADQQEHIFDRLHQVQNGDVPTEGGLGLGLYICRELVELHGGEIWVESEPGRGSTFSFELPKTQRARQTQILIADDDPDVRTALRMQLEREQFNVVTVDGGAETLRQIHHQRPDVVLLDLQMSDLDGAETLAEIRKTWGDLPVVLHTGYAESELMMRALQESPFTVLSKPCAGRQLLDAVRAAAAAGKLSGKQGNTARGFGSLQADSRQSKRQERPPNENHGD